MEGVKTKEQKWQRAYEEHGPSVLAYLINRTGHRSDAEDLLQETFVRVIKSSGTLKDESKLKSYLFSTAHNLMVNFFRRKRIHVLDDVDQEGLSTFDKLSDNDALAPDKEAELNDLHSNVDVVLSDMSEKQQLAFRYGVLESKSYNEIARLTGWSLSQVKINLHRARKTMIQGLGDRGYLDLE